MSEQGTTGWELPAQDETADPTTIRVDQFFPHPPEKVWRALTTPDLLAQWLMTNDFVLEVGHRFTMAGRRVEATGFSGTVASTVLAIDAPRMLQVTWTDAAAEDLVPTTVTWTLEAEGHGTRLFLEHAGFDPDDEIAQLSRRIMGGGWRSMILRRLSEVLDTSA
ncbi:SRPBCC domain-containing protein [Cellulomonas sp. URHE0023]|uniref:SRPBCC family protein n=1 Tax=Cellulomonas sp. URHE0023 TaxID=1380354 RepID=UPI00068ECF71|nr:SRPBCC domain-containing protein [Cellulomonas sp. URHE0023]